VCVCIYIYLETVWSSAHLNRTTRFRDVSVYIYTYRTVCDLIHYFYSNLYFFLSFTVKVSKYNIFHRVPSFFNSNVNHTILIIFFFYFIRRCDVHSEMTSQVPRAYLTYIFVVPSNNTM